jgi:ADP-heptose:LPS heptosyltransferase
MAALRISDPRQRAVVTVADAVLAPLALLRRRRRRTARPARVLCLRLERIGDLVMILPALAELRDALPDAEIDLVVGAWNGELAKAIPAVNRVETIDAAWLARGDAGSVGPLGLARRLRRLRDRRYDLAINFEPDIRSNFALTGAGAGRTAGFGSGGGAAFLDLALDYDPSAHTTDNALRLVRRALGLEDGPVPVASLAIPDARVREAARLLQPLGDGPRIGMHVSAGRAIKQWPEDRFREVALRLFQDRGASIVLTGAPADRELVQIVRRALPADRVVDLTESSGGGSSSGGTDLLTVAAVLQLLDLFVTGDTGPMHLAHAVATPVVAVFGPSDPARYAPRGLRDRVVRVDLPCSPCNRIRRPPARCTGHTPDCLAGVETAAVIAAIDDVLARARR